MLWIVRFVGDLGGTASSLSGKGYPGRHRAESPSPNRATSFLKLDRIAQLGLSPSGSWCTPDLCCTAPGGMRTSPFGALHPLSEWSLSSVVLQRSPIGFWVFQGTGGQGQKAVCTELISESRFKSALH